MRRRDFLTATAMLPLAARASTARGGRVGVLVPVQGAWIEEALTALRRSVPRAVLDVRRASIDRVVAVARELVASGPDVLVTWGTSHTRALHSASRTIPIVAALDDPVASGVAASMALPGGNVTGLVHHPSGGIDGKRLEWLRKLAPKPDRLVFFIGPRSFSAEMLRPLRDASSKTGFALEAREIETQAHVLAALREIGSGGRSCATFPHIDESRFQTTEIFREAVASRVPTLCIDRRYVEAGGLLSYEVSHADYFGRMGAMVGRILAGADPARTPFELPDRTHIAVNRSTATALGLAISPEVLMAADLVVG